jgi:hypothetical protein
MGKTPGIALAGLMLAGLTMSGCESCSACRPKKSSTDATSGAFTTLPKQTPTAGTANTTSPNWGGTVANTTTTPTTPSAAGGPAAQPTVTPATGNSQWTNQQPTYPSTNSPAWPSAPRTTGSVDPLGASGFLGRQLG